MTLSLETPALLFSACSLILLAYTNRFLAIAPIIRSLKSVYDEEESKKIWLQIKNLQLRLRLIRSMQLLGVTSLFFSVLSMTMIFFTFRELSLYAFGLSLFCLLISLGISFREISISINALQYHLSDLEKESKK